MALEKEPEAKLMAKESFKARYLKQQEDAGITKHLGGRKASEELVRLCRIKKGSYVLDVGCGIGLSAARIAKKYGARVVATDISRKMIEWARITAKEEGAEGMVEFMVADAQKLPFKDNTFDAVICESVLAFVKDKGKAVSEFARVVKPGGYVGLNETSWVRAPVPKKLLDYISSTAEKVDILPSEEWEGILRTAGLKGIVAKTYRITMLQDVVDRIQLVGLRRVFRGIWRTLANPSNLKVSRVALKVPRNLYDYYGYGIYVGRKRK